VIQQEVVAMISRLPMARWVRTLREKMRASYERLLLEVNPSNVSLFFIVALAYFVTGKIGQQLAIPNPTPTAFWPPAGIALAAIFLKGNRALPGILMGAFLVNFTTTGLFLVSAGMAIGNTLEAVAGVWLVNRFANGVNAFFKPADVLRYVVFAGVLPALIGGAAGVSFLCMGGAAKWSQFQNLWGVWWVGDTLGAIILGPFLILLFGFRHHRLSWSETRELTLLIIGLAVICMLDFGPPSVHWVPKLFFCVPFLLWAAVRFCPLEVSAACLVMSSLAVSGSLRGFGPYANTTTAPFMVAGYVTVYSVTAMVVVAALSAQRREMEELYLKYYRLKDMTVGNDDSLVDETGRRAS
jgi:integral membrane sensor domain MASE1